MSQNQPQQIAASRSSLQLGRRVAYSKQFLQNTGQYTGDAPFARGEIVGFTKVGETLLAHIAWDRDDLPAKVNVLNLSMVKDGVVMDVD